MRKVCQPDAMNLIRRHLLSISEVGKRSILVNDPHSSLLRPDFDALNVIRSLPESLEFFVEGMGDLDSGLGVELGREGDLKENILHDVRSVGTLELKLLALEKNVIEAPGLGS